MLKDLLLYRLGIFNVLMVVLMTFFASKGWVALIYAADVSGISIGITALFLLTMGSIWNQAYKISQDKNAVKHGKLTHKLGAKRLHKLSHIEASAGMMVSLGLIGTIVGVIVAFHGIDTGAMASASGAESTVIQLMKGMGIALYTTLAGAVTAAWTEINYIMLRTAANILIEDESGD